MPKTILKFVLAFSLCYWLFKNGKLDFSLVPATFQSGHLWVLALFFLIMRLFISPLRFKFLLDTKAKGISYLKVVSFDAIGNLFSVILPGAAAGDVIRFFYYKNLSPELTKGVLATFLTLDRLIGLLSLMALGAVVSLIQYDHFMALNPHLVSLVLFNITTFLVMSLVSTLLFSHLLPYHRTLSLIEHYFARWPKVQGLLVEVHSVKLGFPTFLKCFFVSTINHLCSIAGFWLLIAPFVPEKTMFFDFLTIFPLGLIGASLPITPGGLGVGHILFENLFTFIQVPDGASLFNLYFLMNVLFCLLGIFPYLTITKAK